MTGRLDFVLQFRDEQVAEEVRRKAELGWLDMEFTVYGTAYLKMEQMYYQISSSEKDICALIDQCMAEDIFCGNMLRYSQRCSVPIGTKEDKELEIKKVLAKKMQKIYPRALFEILTNIARETRGDEGYQWLKGLQEDLYGVFSEDKLKFFENQVAYAYSGQRLTREHYSAMKQWVAEERQYMEDDFVQKDLYEKKFYGLMYEDESAKSGFRYLQDSLAAYIYKKKFKLEEQGLLVSPIYEKNYWYHQGKTTAQLKQDYQKTFHEEMDACYWEQLKQISTPKTINGDYQGKINEMSAAAQATYRRYLGRWQITAEPR